MKKLLALLVCSMGLGVAGDTLATQTARLQKVLWTDQKLFGLHENYIDVQVRRLKDMKCGGICWGDGYSDEHGSHIEITAVEDFPASYPVGLRKQMQNKIVMHEVLHFVLHTAGVPPDVEDGVIFAVIPGMKGVK